jgi:hypothetical protein
MTGLLETTHFDSAEEFYVRQGKTVKEIAVILPVKEGSLYKWLHKGNWADKRRAFLGSPRSLGEQMRALLDRCLKQIAAKAEDGVLDDALFDKISKAVAAIKGVERQGADLRVIAVEVMRRYTDRLKARQLSQGEMLMHSESIRDFFGSLE